MKQQAYLLFYVRTTESLPSSLSGNESSESDKDEATATNSTDPPPPSAGCS